MSRLIKIGNCIFVLFFYLVCIVALKNMISESYLAAIFLLPVLYALWYLYRKYKFANIDLRVDEMIIKYRVPMWCCLQIFSMILMVVMTAKLRVNFSWDWGKVISTAVTKVLTGEWQAMEYYGRCHNNLPWLLCLTVYFKFVQIIIPTATEETFYLAAILLSLIFTQITLLLVYQTARLFFSEKRAFLVGVIGLACLPFYLYAQFAYTDTVGMMLVILLVYLYIKMKERRKEKKSTFPLVFCLIILSVLIFHIKILCFIAVIAMILESILNVNSYKKLIFTLVICCALWGGGIKITASVIENEMAVLDEIIDQGKFPWVHWVMMGMNHYGGYSQDDVDFSMNAGSFEEKKNAELQELKRRINDYGLRGTLNHLFYTKISRTWGNSCLAGDDYCHRQPYHEDSIWERLFGVGEDLHWIVLIYTWLFHMLMILGIFFEGICSLKEEIENRNFMMLRYSILGVGIFLTLWECNSRYLMLFLPVMLLLSFRGWEKLCLLKPDCSLLGVDRKKNMNFLGEGRVYTRSNTDRIFLYENLRFILIVLVVIGHVIDLNTSQSKVYRSIFLWIYSFHMPLFLFLSGMFHKNENILTKALGYICIGFLWKVLRFLETMLLFGNASFSFLSDGGIPWYMFVLAMYIVVSYGLRNVNKRFLFVFSVMLACFVGYDATIGDFLYLSRAVVFYPFFLLGEMTNKEALVQVVENKRVKVFAFVVLVIWGLICFLCLEQIYFLRPLFTGRNPFSANEIFSRWGFAFRMLCYIISMITGFSMICIMPNRSIPVITLFGSRTLQVYFWHYFIITILVKLEINAVFMASSMGRLLWILCAILLAFALSLTPPCISSKIYNEIM